MSDRRKENGKSIIQPPEEWCDTDRLHIVPFGGLGEIGMNMMAYCYRDEIVLVDCGCMIPDPSLMGIDLVIPDFLCLEQRKEHVRALILTHGHEDHIGAAPYFLRDFNVPVYATEFTMELLKSKQKDHPHLAKIDARIIEAGDSIEDFKHFRFSFLHVNHSICEAVSVVIDTPEGKIVHTGDFRIDQTPTDGKVFDFEGFAKLGSAGVLALLSDSTNVDRPGFTLSEKKIAQETDAIIHSCEKKVLVCLFSSSIPRVQELADLARRNGRKLHIAGARLVETTTIARGLGLLYIDDSQLISAGEVEKLPPEQVMVIMTGSQGEARSVLSRVAMNIHKDICIKQGDAVIFSSRIIPGRGRSISNLVNHLSRRGAEIFNERTHNVHTSGHAQAGELSTMLNLVRPKLFIPIHGEYYHLIKHSKLARSCGVEKDDILIAENGDVIEIAGRRASIAGKVEAGRVYVDGKGVGDVSHDEIRERRKISATGMVIAILVIRSSTGEVLFGPELISRGFIFDDASTELFNEGKDKVMSALDGFDLEFKADLGELKEEIRLILRRHFNKALQRKPVVIPIVMGM